jgi:hypothetical protein
MPTRLSTALFVLALLVETTACAGGEQTTFRIEPEPSEVGWIHVMASAWSAETTTLSGTAWLGFGPGYASDVVAKIQMVASPGACNPNYLGSMLFHSVEVEGPIDAMPGEGEFMLSVRGPGRGRLVARGIYRDDNPPEACPFVAGEDVPIQVDIDFTVTDDPLGAILRLPTDSAGLMQGPPCGDGLASIPAMAGARLRDIRASAIDDAGAPVVLINATGRRQLALTLRGLDLFEVGPSMSLQSITVPEEGQFDIVPDRGETVTVVAVPAKEIDDAELTFALANGKRLEEGEVFEMEPHASRTVVFAVVSVYREGVALCSQPRGADFTLRPTSMIGTCATGASNEKLIIKGFPGSRLDDWVELTASGECSVVVSVVPFGSLRRRIGFTALGVEAAE